MKILTPEKYWQLYAFLLIAKDRMEEVSTFEKLCLDIVGKTRVTDIIYDTESELTKDKFNEILVENGFTIDWKGNLENDKQETKQ